MFRNGARQGHGSELSTSGLKREPFGATQCCSAGRAQGRQKTDVIGLLEFDFQRCLLTAIFGSSKLHIGHLKKKAFYKYVHQPQHLTCFAQVQTGARLFFLDQHCQKKYILLLPFTKNRFAESRCSKPAVPRWGGLGLECIFSFE